jgi:hypothetical protein
MEVWVAILIGAGGTWLIAIIAIWDKFISAWLFRPGLVVGQGEFSGTAGTHEDGRAARYYRVPVRNPTRFPAAHDVQLVLTRIEKSGEGEVETVFDEPIPVAWERRELNPLLTRTVGTEANASLFFAQDDGVLGFTPALSPTGELLATFPRIHQAPFRLWVTLRAVSIEADSPSIRLKIDWNGQWHNDKVGLSGVCRVTVDPPQDQ